MAYANRSLFSHSSEGQGLNSKCQQGCFLWRPRQGLSLSAAGGCGQPWCLLAWSCITLMSAPSSVAFWPMSVSQTTLSFICCRFRAALNPGLILGSLITSAKTLHPTKVTVTGTGPWDLDLYGGHTSTHSTLCWVNRVATEWHQRG